MGLFNLFKDNKAPKNSIEKVTSTDDTLETYNIEFPFYVKLYKKDFNEDRGDEPIELKGNEAYKILENDNIEGICYDFESSELYQYWEDLSKKIINMKMQFLEKGYIKISVSVREKLNDTEKQELLSLITSQMSDGWGEGNFDYLSDNNDRYNVIFWEYNNWNINFI